MDWWERGLMPEDRRRINRSQSRSNRLSSTASACRSLIFIAAPSCGDAEPLPFRPEPSPSKCRRPPANFNACLSIGLARPAKLRPAPEKYLGRLTDGRASLLECRLWPAVDRRPLPDYRRSSFVGGASPKNCRSSSFVRQRWLFECRRSMFKVRSR